MSKPLRDRILWNVDKYKGDDKTLQGATVVAGCIIIQFSATSMDQKQAGMAVEGSIRTQLADMMIESLPPMTFKKGDSKDGTEKS